MNELCLHEQSVNSQNPPNKPTLVNSVNTVFSLAPMRGCPSFYARKQLFRPASPELQIPVETKCRRNKATKLQQGCSSLSLSLSPPLSLLCLSCFGLPSRRYAESICSFSSRGKVCFTPRAPARPPPVASSRGRSKGGTGTGAARRGRTPTPTPLAAVSYCALPPFNLCSCVSLALPSYLCLSYRIRIRC